MKMTFLGTALFTLFVSAPAFAVDCQDQQTTADFVQCAGQDFAQADTELNATWNDVLSHFEKVDADLAERRTHPNFKAVDRITDAQLAWIELRDNDCAAARLSAPNGTLYRPTEIRCRTKRTKERTAQLQRLLTLQSDRNEGPAADEFSEIYSSLAVCHGASSTIQWKLCTGNVSTVADSRLNDEYAVTKQALRDNDAAIEALTQAELAWIKMVSNDCAASTAISWGGTGYSGFGATCVALSTLERKQQLSTVVTLP